MDRKVEPELKAYIQGIVGAFAKDDRILGWDVWNEPQNEGHDDMKDVPAKIARVNELLPKVFAWVRAEHPE